eukprot:112865_1
MLPANPVSDITFSKLTADIDYLYHRTRPYPHDIKEKESLCQYIQQCVEYLQERCIDEAKQMHDDDASRKKARSNNKKKSSKRPRITMQRLFLEHMTHRNSALNTKWTVHKFGSETWGTSIGRDSDIDIAVRLNFSNRRSDKIYMLQRLSRIISENDSNDHDLLRVQLLLHAKYPIIRVYHKQYEHIKADISIADRYCLKRNQLIIEYIHYYETQYRFPLKKLIVFIKYWSKQRAINGAYYGYLSSFGYTLMILHFIHYFIIKHYKRKGGASLSTLVCAFFEFYAFEYTAAIHSISIDAEFGKKYDTRCFMEVMDPMNDENNVAKNVGYYQYCKIQREFVRCASIMRNSANVGELFKEITENMFSDGSQEESVGSSLMEIKANDSPSSVSVYGVSSVCDDDDDAASEITPDTDNSI